MDKYKLTKEQSVVLDAKVRDGYVILGAYKPLSGISGICVAVVKWKHTMYINALGYDEYLKGVIYEEIK